MCLYIVDVVFVIFEEDVKGMFGVGMFVDFVVLFDDMLFVELIELSEVDVLMIFVGGEFVYFVEEM